MPRMPLDWSKLKEIVADALEEPPGTRVAFVERACGGDLELKTEVMSLVNAADDSDGVIDPRTDAWLGLGGPDLLSMGGQKIGRYRLQTLIAEGAMAAVYRAHQPALNRVVALKLFRTSLPLVDARKRFQREAQALARLKHPNIAQIFEAGLHQTDGGSASNGRADDDDFRQPVVVPKRDESTARALPYIAIELVDGPTLTDWAMQQNLDRRQRVELLIKVADAVQAAHQQAIIHCDLKPPNVLVEAATGEPKVLDFGIARSIAHNESSTWQTTAGVLMGTPGYMSPEQASSSNDAVDVRSDVYALGVMLFELLTGKMPLDLSGLTIHETLRRIEENNTTRLMSLDPTLEGDLDVIVEKAISRDKADRYATAAAFAEDLRRHLDEKPILAVPPSTWYVARKFAKRHRGTIALVAGAVALLVTATAVSTVGFARAEHQRSVAVSARQESDGQRRRAEDERARAEDERARAEDQRSLAEAARAAAETSLNRSRLVTAFLSDLIRSPHPTLAGKDVTVLDAVRRMEPQIAERFKDDPIAEADVRSVIGDTLLELGGLTDLEMARKQFERVVAITTEQFGPRASQTFAPRSKLVETLRWLFRPDDAKPIMDALLADVRADPTLDELKLAGILSTAAGLAGDLEQWDEAIRTFREVIDLRTRVEGPDADNTTTSMNNLASVYMQLSRYDEATRLLRDVIDRLARKHGKADPRLLVPEFNLAQALSWSGRPAEAVPLFRDLIPRRTAAYGANDADTLLIAKALSEALQALGQHDESLRTIDDAIERSKRSQGERSEFTLRLLNSRGTLLLSMDRYDEAATLFAQLAEALDATQAQASTRLTSRRNLATALGGAGRSAEALAVYDRVAKDQAAIDPAGYDMWLTLYGRGQTLFLLGRHADAERDLRRAMDGFVATGSTYEAALSRRALARSLIGLKRFEEAERELVAADAALRDRDDPPLQAKTALAYVTLYDAWGKPERADPYRATARGATSQPTTRPSSRPTSGPASTGR